MVVVTFFSSLLVIVLAMAQCQQYGDYDKCTLHSMQRWPFVIIVITISEKLSKRELYYLMMGSVEKVRQEIQYVCKVDLTGRLYLLKENTEWKSECVADSRQQ